MKVRLVTTTSLESLEEYRSDQGIWFAGGGLFIGAALGILVNWATGSEMTRTSGILIVTFIIVAVVFGYFFYEGNKRIGKVKARMIGNKDE